MVHYQMVPIKPEERDDVTIKTEPGDDAEGSPDQSIARRLAEDRDEVGTRICLALLNASLAAWQRKTVEQQEEILATGWRDDRPDGPRRLIESLGIVLDRHVDGSKFLGICLEFANVIKVFRDPSGRPRLEVSLTFWWDQNFPRGTYLHLRVPGTHSHQISCDLRPAETLEGLIDVTKMITEREDYDQTLTIDETGTSSFLLKTMEVDLSQLESFSTL